MRRNRTAFVTFFPILPDNMGSSAVINSRFKNWPGKKMLFQISHVKKINNNNIQTVFIKKETPIYKILKLPEVIRKVFNYLKDAKNKTIIIEGASWIFYSFVTLVLLKILLPNSKVIYISHSIESEIRKKYSNMFIFFLTKILEKLVFTYSDLSTSVSKKERAKIIKLYKKETILYPNAISLNVKLVKKVMKGDYIIYTGSYTYRPNKYAIDYLSSKIMPILLENNPKLKLVITGGGYNKKIPWLINKGIVSKKKLYNLIYFSKCMCIPLKFGSGTRIKIIEALSLGAIVISSKKGIEGIELINKAPPFITNNTREFIKIINKIIRDYKNIKKKSIKSKTYYLKKYSMKSITRNFIQRNLNAYLK